METLIGSVSPGRQAPERTSVCATIVLSDVETDVEPLVVLVASFAVGVSGLMLLVDKLV